mmetsp:Transcript_41068/g.118079  ORF Transcript_41068/g.118079 Transcript_41068/m.118079 type:complete len:186 (+) Transcript_41068:96-653(+)
MSSWQRPSAAVWLVAAAAFLADLAVAGDAPMPGPGAVSQVAVAAPGLRGAVAVDVPQAAEWDEDLLGGENSTVAELAELTQLSGDSGIAISSDGVGKVNTNSTGAANAKSLYCSVYKPQAYCHPYSRVRGLFTLAGCAARCGRYVTWGASAAQSGQLVGGCYCCDPLSTRSQASSSRVWSIYHCV